MKVYVIWHISGGPEIDIVKVVARESDAKAYVTEYEKNNVNTRHSHEWQLADYEEFDLVLPDPEPDLFDLIRGKFYGL
jgi:hypothetical protein